MYGGAGGVMRYGGGYGMGGAYGAGGGYGGASMYGYGSPYGGGMYGMQTAPAVSRPQIAGTAEGGQTGGAESGDQTGTFLQSRQSYMASGIAGPRVIPNAIDNSLLIQATRTDYEKIMKLLRELDTPPRQVLIDAKFYEVTLTGALSNGVAWYLQQQGSANSGPHTFLGNLAGGAFNASTGMMLGHTKELMAFIKATENDGRTKVISAPSILATDGIAASINVGEEVPTLAAQAVSGVTQGGTSLFANTVNNRTTGLTLNIVARINPSGIVTLIINQQFSSPSPPQAGDAIQSPSFQNRTINTQVTVQDGDTIAIGGIISESSGFSSNGVPVLHRLPIVGWAFGSKSYDHSRTELIVMMTPRVIYDTNELVEASDELKTRLKDLVRLTKE